MKKTLSKIYQLYNVPPNLAEHMLLVAALGEHLMESWIEPPIDKEILTNALLLHDIGNLIKFDLDTDWSEQMIDKTDYLSKQENHPLDYWQKKQREMIKKYGSNADEANVAIIKELIAYPKVSQLLEDHSFETLGKCLQGSDWGKKLVFYCDLRVEPRGLASVEERIRDLRKRYQHKDSQWADEDIYQRWLNSSLELEKQLDQHTSINLKTIKQSDFDQLVIKLADRLLEVEV